MSNQTKILNTYFLENPYKESDFDSKKEYLKDACLKLGIEFNYNSIRSKYNRFKTNNPDSFIRREKLNKDGKVISSQVDYYVESTVDKSKFEVTKYSERNPVDGSWTQYKPLDNGGFDKEAIIEEMKAHAPIYPIIKRDTKRKENLLVIDPADIHLDKLSYNMGVYDNFNLKDAKNVVQQAILRLLDLAKGFDISQIVFVAGNDILHTDLQGRSTTSGTPQDSGAMWYNAFQAAKDLYIWTIEALVTLADVHVIFCPSNHDFQSGYMLLDSIYSWFHKSENISFDISMAHRKYFDWGKNLLGFTHGDGAKESDLAEHMAAENRENGLWSKTSLSYFYVHHLHHKIRKKGGRQIEKDKYSTTILGTNKTEKDFEVEYVRSPSKTDYWHHKSGYYNFMAVECFIHSFDKGQIARFTDYL